MKAIGFLILWMSFVAGMPASATVTPKKTADTAHFYMRHSYDVLKYRLDIELYQCFLNPYPRTYRAYEVITLRVDSAIGFIALNAVNTSLVIDSVTLAGSGFTHSNDTLSVALDRVYQPGEVLDVGIWYRHNNVNDHAFYASYGTVFTDSPPEGARKWLPCWDRPSDKAAWELFAKVPLNARLGSNGVLADSVISGDTITYHWKTDLPVATYLITLSAKVNYLVHKTYWKPSAGSDSIPILAYYRPGEYMTVIDSIIGPATTFYSALFGDYPFEKIGFATLNNQFPWGGMENQTMVNLRPGGYGNASTMVHEHAHQWFGDLVTCGTWADVWLNEGFATYCRELWVEHDEGYDTYKSHMNTLANYYLSNNPGWPLYQPGWAIHTPGGNELYNQAVSYNKGACVLFQLRYVMGDSLFFRAMREYATDPALKYGNAVTLDLIDRVSQVAGQDMKWFFDEWVYAPDHPEYENTFEVDSLGAGSWKVTFIATQTQPGTVFFRMPLELKITFSGATDTLVRIMNDTNRQPFSFYFNRKPVDLVFDPSRNILLKQASTIYGIRKATGNTGFRLHQNEPNPFSHRTMVTYDVASAGNVNISVLDSSAKLRRCLVNHRHEPGVYRFDFSGPELSSGTYFVTMEAGNFRETRKMVLTR